jgi:hypothetical protein
MSGCLAKEPAATAAATPLVTPAEFKAEVRHWASRIGVHPAAVHVRAMRWKWASCSATGRLTFDAGLLAQPAAFRTEAIVHELLHLRIPNHGRLFRSMLAAYMAEAGGREAQL